MDTIIKFGCKILFENFVAWFCEHVYVYYSHLINYNLRDAVMHTSPRSLPATMKWTSQMPRIRRRADQGQAPESFGAKAMKKALVNGKVELKIAACQLAKRTCNGNLKPTDRESVVMRDSE